jgi:hypothetical protein
MNSKLACIISMGYGGEPGVCFGLRRKIKERMSKNGEHMYINRDPTCVT